MGSGVRIWKGILPVGSGNLSRVNTDRQEAYPMGV
jgi:hypothetical protein